MESKRSGDEASVAQVHVAAGGPRPRPRVQRSRAEPRVGVAKQVLVTGERVAVKVQKPGVEQVLQVPTGECRCGRGQLRPEP